MNIGIYYRSPFEIGGVEKTILQRMKLFKELGHNSIFIYKDCRKQYNMLEQFAKVGKVVRDDNVTDELDYLIYDSIYNNTFIPSNEKIQVINGNVISGNETLSNTINMDKYVTVSEECQNELKEKYNIDSVVIPNIIKEKEIKELAKEKYDLPKKKYNFVVVARLDYVKGFDNLLKFVKKLEEKTKDYQIVVVGSNNNFPKLENEIKAKFKKYNVIFEGMQNNPYKYMKNVDYLVQLSKFESQCMVMYESLIIGTPVIVTDFGTAVKDVTDERGFVLKQDLSNLDIDAILKKKNGFKFDFSYPNVKEKWKEILKPTEKKNIKFSIIIPNYNNAKWLDKCLTSVAEQTYKNYEVIFIDDMSEDKSVEIVENYVDKINNIKIIRNQTKRLNGGTRNVGIIEATGDYTLFIDSDDTLKDKYVLEKLNKFIKNEDLIRLGYELCNGQKRKFQDIPQHKNMYDVFIEPTCAIWTKVVKTDIIKQCLFKEGTLMEDKVHHYRLVDKCKTFKDFPYVTHCWNRLNTESTSTKKNYKWNNCIYRHIADMLDFIEETKNEKYKEFVKKKVKQAKTMAEKGDYRQI